MLPYGDSNIYHHYQADRQIKPDGLSIPNKCEWIT